jgi:hypothetical protein
MIRAAGCASQPTDFLVAFFGDPFATLVKGVAFLLHGRRVSVSICRQSHAGDL